MAQADDANFSHEPVLVDAVTGYLAEVPGVVVIDGTTGGGGHAAALLAARHDLVVLGLDRDPDAIAAASERLAPFGARIVLRRDRFSNMAVALDDARAAGDLPDGDVGGVLLDLGVSSHQLDTSTRGFSYRHEGPLDMRMAANEGPTAAEFLATVDEPTLSALLAANGERRFARAIARSVLAAHPTTTSELAHAVERAVPPAVRRRGHVASRTFQALRVAVNEELEELARALVVARSVLAPGGRLAVISYHSGEDALVKAAFRDAATGGCTCPPDLPCGCGAVPTMRLVTRGAQRPTQIETARNPRARSARLRVAELLGPT